MLKFAQDFRTCRKVLFARYFASTHDNSQAFDEDESEEPCGSCDNVSSRFASLRCFAELM